MFRKAKALLRKALVVLAGVATGPGPGAGAGAWAGPPAATPVEWRETDPVAREFFQQQTVSYGYTGCSGGPGPAPSPARGPEWWAWGYLWELLLDRLTVPLGTVSLDPPTRD